MPEMTIKIGTFNKEGRTVPVTFTSGDVKHERTVNAVLKDDGSYGKAGTKARVEEVAQGVAYKIALGVITNPPSAPELPAPGEPTAE